MPATPPASGFDRLASGRRGHHLFQNPDTLGEIGRRFLGKRLLIQLDAVGA